MKKKISLRSCELPQSHPYPKIREVTGTYTMPFQILLFFSIFLRFCYEFFPSLALLGTFWHDFRQNC